MLPFYKYAHFPPALPTLSIYLWSGIFLPESTQGQCRNGLGRLWGTLSGPVPVLEPKNRQTEAGPSLCGSEKAGPQGTEARGEAPLGDSACSSLTLLSAAAKIHSLQPCLGANQPPCP